MAIAVRKASSARSGIGGIALEQDLAAKAMQEGKRATMFDLIRKAECFVDPSKRAVRAKCFRLELR